MQMHITIKKYKEKKFSDLFLVAANQTPPRQCNKSIISENDVSKKGNTAQAPSSVIVLIIDRRFLPWKKSAVTAAIHNQHRLVLDQSRIELVLDLLQKL
jgi:hypothetical protein